MEKHRGYYITNIPRDLEILRELFTFLKCNFSSGSPEDYLLHNSADYLIDDSTKDDGYWAWNHSHLEHLIKRCKKLDYHDFTRTVMCKLDINKIYSEY